MADLEADQELSMKTESIAGFVRDANVGERDDESLESMESPSQPEDDEADRGKKNVKSMITLLSRMSRRSFLLFKMRWITKQPKFAAVLVSADVTTTLTQIIQ
ncbi:hypothetical protein PInf_023456 [Phytophthora infestans]|nr:hypothetical protein PInf_023456 [Phytophthora infestans]